MSWLKIDDKFASHPKVAELTDREFRVFVRVLCYCAEYKTGGAIPDTVWNEIPGLSRRMGARFFDVGLWDVEDGCPVVHEWEVYNPSDPTNAARQQRYRQRHRNGKSNAGVTV